MNPETSIPRSKNQFWQKAYRYDGSFAGFLCCIGEAVRLNRIPAAILSEEAPLSLFPEQWIETEENRARRVYTALRKRISPQIQEQTALGFLTCCPEKELLLLQFIRMALQDGNTVLRRLTDPTIHTLLKAIQHLQHEAHLLTGFLRFSDSGGVLTSTIDPKNYVLPLLETHFSNRYSAERFLIWDRTHKTALIHFPGMQQILPMDSFTPPPPDRSESEYRLLWKRFYETVAIEGRRNPCCQRTHMPKRYWGNMTEHQPDPVWDSGPQNLTVLQKDFIMEPDSRSHVERKRSPDSGERSMLRAEI